MPTDEELTANPELLLEESDLKRLELHPALLPENLAFVVGRKTVGLKIKPVSMFLSCSGDAALFRSLRLQTMEGPQSFDPNAFISMGPLGEFYQQTEEKLHAKYDLDSIDPTGWVHCSPKVNPDTGLPYAVACAPVVPAAFLPGPCGGFHIVHPRWGDIKIDASGKSTQYGRVGDYLAVGVSPSGLPDWSDIYRIDLKAFTSTYELDIPPTVVKFGQEEIE